MNVKKFFRGPVFFIVLALLLLFTASQLFGGSGFQRVDTEQGLQLLREGKVEQAKMVDREQRVDLVLKEDFEDKGTKVQFNYVAPRGLSVAETIAEADLAKPFNDEVPRDSIWSSLFITMIPILILLAAFWFLLSQMQGGGSRVMNFGKSKAKLVSKDTPQVTFADVAGAEEAVEELEEIKDFLSDPGKFQRVGAKIPKGVLLYGPPGTGKTLLARAVAGEAGVPFYTISGSDFVEMFVGVGASRVRDLFEQAKANAPAIIFVDEIDAVGRHRGAGMGGGHDEREQTLNQLLVEMDGFDVKTNVIMIAATNRPDILDPALLRPGRFDRQIAVDAPNLQGRHEILKVHAKGKPTAKDVDLLTLARRTPGMTGADLANVLNEAALLTARADATIIDNAALDEAIERVQMGPQRRTRVMSEHEKKVTAYHEGGHALVAAAMRHTDPVTKVTILPRGRALGVTTVAPLDDKHGFTRNELLDRLAWGLGGFVAEEYIFHDPSTGAANDIQQVTGMARRMVTEFGMSSRVGLIKLGESNHEPFLGRDMGHQRDYSEDTARIIDEEVRSLVDTAHSEAWSVLDEYRDVLDELVLALFENESLNKDQLAQIFAPVQKRALRPVWVSNDARQVSSLPPVPSPKERKQLNGSAPLAPQDQIAAAHENQRVDGDGEAGWTSSGPDR